MTNYFNKYCCEDASLIENYDLAVKDNFKGWAFHHRLETHDENGNRREKGKHWKLVDGKRAWY